MQGLENLVGEAIVYRSKKKSRLKFGRVEEGTYLILTM